MESENGDQVYLDKIVKRLYRNLSGARPKQEKEELRLMKEREDRSGCYKRLKSH